MTAVQNLHAMTNLGPFHARVPRSRPLTTKGHAPGIEVGKGAVPEFSAQTLPVGSAPADRTYQPSPIPVQNQSYLSNEVRTVAIDAIPGATSADVNKGVGQPMYGQSSRELRGRGGGHKGRRGGRKDKIGLAGVGADPRDPVKERGLDLDVPKGMEKLMYHDFAGAEEKLPQGAETVATERY